MNILFLYNQAFSLSSFLQARQQSFAIKQQLPVYVGTKQDTDLVPIQMEENIAGITGYLAKQLLVSQLNLTQGHHFSLFPVFRDHGIIYEAKITSHHCQQDVSAGSCTFAKEITLGGKNATN